MAPSGRPAAGASALGPPPPLGPPLYAGPYGAPPAPAPAPPTSSFNALRGLTRHACDIDTLVWPFPSRKNASDGSAEGGCRYRRPVVCAAAVAILAALAISAGFLAHSLKGSKAEPSEQAVEERAPEDEASTTAMPSVDFTGRHTGDPPVMAGCDGSGCTTTGSAETAALTTSTPMAVAEGCYGFTSRMAENPLQAYHGSPDKDAHGTATCDFCTNGTLSCSAVLKKGRSELIAFHLHIAEGSSGSAAEGPPIIAFCGKNRRGSIEVGMAYTRECEGWGADGIARIEGAPGVLVPASNDGTSVSERVADIVRRPEMYYLNLHSFASWQHFAPTPVGICRGPLERRRS